MVAPFVAQAAESGIPLPILCVLGVIILGGLWRLLFGGRAAEVEAKLGGFDPADSPEYYMIERDDHWENDGYLGEDGDE